MSDDLVKRLRNPPFGTETSERNLMESAADRLETQANEITRLRAALATARREGMEEAAQRLQELHRNHKYNPKTGEGSEHDVGYYRATAEGVAHILYAAAKEGK